MFIMFEYGYIYLVRGLEVKRDDNSGDLGTNNWRESGGKSQRDEGHQFSI